MTTVFEKIIANEIPSAQLYEDETCIAILDAFPTTTGQTLIIPKEPIDYIFDLPDETYQHLLMVSKKIAHVLDIALNPLRTCVVVEGFEVPHAHIKLYPVYEPSLQIQGGAQVPHEALLEVAEKIKKHL